MTSLTDLSHAVKLEGQCAQVVLADQRVDVLLNITNKLLPRCQLVRSSHFPPSWQCRKQTL